MQTKSTKVRSVRGARPRKSVQDAIPDAEDALKSFENILEKSQASVNQIELPGKEFGSDDEDGDAVAHKRLVTALGQLHRSQHIKVPTRTEISDRRGEFDLVKSHADNIVKPLEAKVTLAGLVDSLKKNNKHTEVTKELTKLQKNSKKLAKPLEKPVAERLARTLAYEKTVSELDRWEPVVEKNKVEEQISFPLIDHEAVKLANSAPREPLSYRIKSDLMKELEKLEPAQPEPSKAEQAERNLRLKEELLEQRKELSRLRRKESYEIEKAKRQNKIKSKKYHKVLKKEKLKKKLAEFEELRKVDPEAVLVELEKIEKARLEERAHQRHRNTGTWAKNLQVRAKFDRDARQELTQQIEISRQLKEKKGDDAEDSEDEQDVEEDALEKEREERNPFNPWLKSKAGDEDAAANEEFSGYRKYWETRNKNQEEMDQFKTEEATSEDDADDPQEDDSDAESFNGPKVTQYLDNGFEVESVSSSPIGNTTATLDEIFEEIDGEEMVSDKVSRKLQSLRRDLQNSRDQRKGKENGDAHEKRQSKGLEFNKKARLADADDQLDEKAAGEEANGPAMESDVKSLRKLLASQAEKEEEEKKSSVDELINPNKFIAVEPRQLQTALPDSWNDEDVDEADEDVDLQRMTIAEAFEDDDIVTDFRQEKEDKVKSEQPEDINLTLPGWGCWTGSGISEKEATKGRRRMVLKFPKELPRKDDNKEKLILNETVSAKLKEHLVNEIPFPFRSVGDYEASIRAPITRTFVPETAHRVLTKPSIVTKMGKIIEPMDEETLLKADGPIGKRKLKTAHKLEDGKKLKKEL